MSDPTPSSSGQPPLSSDHEQLIALQQRLEQWKQKARQQLEDAAKKNESLRRQLDTVTADRDALRAKEEDRNVATDALVSRAVSLQEQLSAAETKLREQAKHLQEVNEAHATQVQSLESHVSQLQSENENLQEQKTKQQQTMAALGAEAAKARKAAIAARDRLRSLGYENEEQEEGAENDFDEDVESTTFDHLTQETGGTSSSSSSSAAAATAGSASGDVTSSSSPARSTASNRRRNNNASAGNQLAVASAATNMRIAMLEQQLEERTCSIAVINALYTQAKAEARAATALMASIRDEHNRAVDHLRSAIATMTVQVAAKSSAADSLRMQLDEANKRAAWFESEVLRLRDDAAERERVFDEMFQSEHQQQKQEIQVQQQQQQQLLSQNNKKKSSPSASNNNRTPFHGSSRDSSSTGDDGFDRVSGDDDGFLEMNENGAGAGGSNNSSGGDKASLMQKKIMELEQRLQTATQALDQALSAAQAKDARNRHLELRVEEQQGMVRHLAKQLSDASLANNNNIISNHGSASSSSSASPSKRKSRRSGGGGVVGINVVGEGTTDSASDNEFDGISASSSSASATRRCYDSAVLVIESSKNRMQRVFNTYKVMAPMAFGALALILFLIWFSRGSGPTVNKLDMLLRRNEQLESELGTIREALGKLREKCVTA